MSRTLLELSAEARDLAERLATVEEARGEAETEEAQAALTEAEAALEQMLALVGEDIERKCDGYGDIIAEFDARADVMKAQEDLYRRKRQVAEGAARRLKERLLYALEGLGLSRVDGERWRLAVQASPPSVQVRDEDLAVASGFGEIVQTVKVDRKAILAAWQEDPEAVSGFADVVRGSHLRVR